MKRFVLTALAAVVLLYAADFIRLRMIRPPTAQVQIQQYYAVRLKGSKVEYMPLDSTTQTCSHSLFPQMGYTPCWYVNRHRMRQIDIGDVGD